MGGDYKDNKIGKAMNQRIIPGPYNKTKISEMNKTETLTEGSFR